VEPETQQSPEADDQHRWFTTTHWSVVLGSRGDSAQSAAALETLCGTYWPPLYTYIRRRGHEMHDAQDLTQQFLANLLAKDFLEQVSPAKGKFRSFLLASLNNFLASEHERATTQKRGGGKALIPLDAGDTEQWLRAELASAETPEAIFERRWALTLIERAFEKLRAEHEKSAKLPQFERLKEFLEDNPQHGDYEVVARDLRTSASAVAVAVHRLRHRYGELLRREIADTVAPEEVEDELRYLVSVLAR
jgi:DNA-directed RNA polymerase specialized sigma24 family protein